MPSIPELLADPNPDFNALEARLVQLIPEIERLKRRLAAIRADIQALQAEEQKCQSDLQTARGELGSLWQRPGPGSAGA